MAQRADIGFLCGETSSVPCQFAVVYMFIYLFCKQSLALVLSRQIEQKAKTAKE